MPMRILFVLSLRSMATGRCSSHVGMRGRVQRIRCAPPFNLGTMIHEIGHAIGLHHEHQRRDRDRVVTVFPFSPKVDFGKKNPPWALPVGIYDCGSVMHYPRRRFRRVRLGSCARGTTMGQRNGPSRGDLAAVNSLYRRRR